MPKRAGSLKNTIVRSDSPGLCLVSLPERRRGSHENVLCNSPPRDTHPKTPPAGHSIGPAFRGSAPPTVNFCAFSRGEAHQSDVLLDRCQAFVPLVAHLVSRPVGLPNSRLRASKSIEQNSGP